jgi:hypothetical protein
MQIGFKDWIESLPAMWDRASAEAYVESVRHHFPGYDLKIIGGVRRHGRSDHDLDILVTPGKGPLGISGEFLEVLAQKENPFFRGVLYEVMAGDRVVDFFSLTSLVRRHASVGK